MQPWSCLQIALDLSYYNLHCTMFWDIESFRPICRWTVGGWPRPCNNAWYCTRNVQYITFSACFWEHLIWVHLIVLFSNQVIFTSTTAQSKWVRILYSVLLTLPVFYLYIYTAHYTFYISELILYTNVLICGSSGEFKCNHCFRRFAAMAWIYFYPEMLNACWHCKILFVSIFSAETWGKIFAA